MGSSTGTLRFTSTTTLLQLPQTSALAARFWIDRTILVSRARLGLVIMAATQLLLRLTQTTLGSIMVLNYGATSKGVTRPSKPISANYYMEAVSKKLQCATWASWGPSTLEVHYHPALLPLWKIKQCSSLWIGSLQRRDLRLVTNWISMCVNK